MIYGSLCEMNYVDDEEMFGLVNTDDFDSSPISNDSLHIPPDATPDEILQYALDYGKAYGIIDNRFSKYDRIPRDIFDKILFKIINLKGEKGKLITPLRAKMLNWALPRLVKIISVWLLKKFIRRKLKNTSTIQIDRHFKNGKLHRWLRTEINKIYKAHSEYRNVTIEEFQQANAIEYNLAEWRDKSATQRIRRFSFRSITIIIMILFAMIPLPWKFMNSLYAIPAKILLGYLGFKLATGSISQLAVDFEDETLMMGITLTKYCYEMTNVELVVRRNDGKMVRVDLPEIPKHLYLPNRKEVQEILDSDIDFEDIKREVESRGAYI